MTGGAKTVTGQRPERRNPHRAGRRQAQRGFSLLEMAAVMTAAGAILGPVLASFESSIDAIRGEQNEVVLETAREALIRYAAQHDGCLPFAADWEGGLPDTGQTGAPGYTDTGIAANNTRAGDLPWADLGLAESFRDGDSLRIQYYVASQYADLDVGCAARSIGEAWNPMVSYDGSVASIYLHFTPPDGSGGLYEINGFLASGTRPDSGFNDIGDALPSSLLELRRGPDVKKNGDESDVLSAQNVFVLIAVGDNINANSSINLPYMRDENHRSNSGGAPWNLNQNNVDGVIFAATHEFNGSDEGKDGDDMVMAMSFLSFKTDVRKFGVQLAPICETSC